MVKNRIATIAITVLAGCLIGCTTCSCSGDVDALNDRLTVLENTVQAKDKTINELRDELNGKISELEELQKETSESVNGRLEKYENDITDRIDRADEVIAGLKEYRIYQKMEMDSIKGLYRSLEEKVLDIAEKSLYPMEPEVTENGGILEYEGAKGMINYELGRVAIIMDTCQLFEDEPARELIEKAYQLTECMDIFMFTIDENTNDEFVNDDIEERTLASESMCLDAVRNYYLDRDVDPIDLQNLDYVIVYVDLDTKVTNLIYNGRSVSKKMAKVKIDRLMKKCLAEFEEGRYKEGFDLVLDKLLLRFELVEHAEDNSEAVDTEENNADEELDEEDVTGLTEDVEQSTEDSETDETKETEHSGDDAETDNQNSETDNQGKSAQKSKENNDVESEEQ